MNIEKIVNTRSDISAMLAKMREISNQSKVFNSAHTASAPSDFGDILTTFKTAIDKVDTMQIQSDQLKNSYLSGDSSISMAQVVLASQKSSLAFQGLVSVRNKLLEFYKEIMNMPI